MKSYRLQTGSAARGKSLWAAPAIACQHWCSSTPLSFLLPWLIATNFIFLLAVLQGQTAFAGETFKVNGKSVPRNVYEAAVLVQQSNELLAQGNLDRAAAKLKMALKWVPDFAPAHANLAIILARNGQNKEALYHFKECTRAEDAMPAAFLNLAGLYQTCGDLDSAIDTLKLFIERSDDAASRTYAENQLKMLQGERARRLKAGAAHAGSKEKQETDYFDANPSDTPAPFWSPFRMPLKVYIDPSALAEGFEPRYSELLRQSFADWQKATGGKLSFLFLPSKSNCDIDCVWTSDPALLGHGVENGDTETIGRAGLLDHAHIVLRSKGIEGGFPFTDNTIINTCRHEIGHALGISWHSPDPADLMFFTLPLADKEQAISPRDKNTLLKIYKRNPDLLALWIDFAGNPERAKALVPLLLPVLFLAALLLVLLPKRNKKQPRKKK